MRFGSQLSLYKYNVSLVTTHFAPLEMDTYFLLIVLQSFSDDFEQIFQFDEQQQPIQPQQPNLLFPVDAAQGRWSMLCQSKNFNEDSSPDLSWSSSSDSMTSVTSLDEAMLSLSSSDSEEEDSQKAR